MTENEQSKREFIKKTAYVIPCILTLKSIPSFAGTGSGEAKTAESYSGKDKKGNNGVGNGWDPQPPGNPPVNDGPGTGPGNPGEKGKKEDVEGLGKKRRS